MKIVPTYGTPVAPVVGLTVTFEAGEAMQLVTEGANLEASHPHVAAVLNDFRVALAGSRNGVLPS
jgi:hypothetical protein